MSSFEALAEVVAPQVLLDAIRIGELLTELKVPYVLIGGLAVGLNGHPRATKDVDYMVGPEAFQMTEPILVYREELKEQVAMGVIDLLAVPTHYPFLAEQLRLPSIGDVPVIAVEPLVLLKLDANRPQDRADVAKLVDAGASVVAIRNYLDAKAPELTALFLELVD
jgi:hypothetical protein